MERYKKFKEELNKQGISSAIKKTFQYFFRKTEKFYPNNIIKSLEVSFSNDYIIVYWYDSTDNFGDQLNPILIRNLFGKQIFHPKKIINIKNKPVYTAIGSILQNLNYNNLEIWGSGFISEDSKINKVPKKIHAVRGPLTRKLFIKQGIPCPEVYGDPGILVPKIYSPLTKKEYVLGIIPHFVDKESEVIKGLKFKYKEDILIIDIQKDWKNVIENINKCEFIASSSLHGIITADAYNIPSLWIKLSNNIIGGHFKFQDYMLSVNRNQMEPFLLSEEHTLTKILNSFENYKIKIDIDKLINSCPFKTT